MAVILYKLEVDGVDLVAGLVFPVFKKSKPGKGIAAVYDFAPGIGRLANAELLDGFYRGQFAQTFDQFGFIRRAARILQPKIDMVDKTFFQFPGRFGRCGRLDHHTTRQGGLSQVADKFPPAFFFHIFGLMANIYILVK